MKKNLRIGLGITAVCIVILFLMAFSCSIPPEDDMEAEGFPAEYRITKTNYINYQTGNACAAYACAYLLRPMDISAGGRDPYSDIRRIFGFVPVSSLIGDLEGNGLEAAAFHGTIGTFQQRLCRGAPIIVFTSIPGDTHYMVAVGYDTEYVYFAESMEDNAYAVNNIYIVAD